MKNTLPVFPWVPLTTVSSGALVFQSAMDGHAAAIIGLGGVAVGSPTAIFSAISADSMPFWVGLDGVANDHPPVAAGISGGGNSRHCAIQTPKGGSLRVDAAPLQPRPMGKLGLVDSQRRRQLDQCGSIDRSWQLLER